MEEVTEEKKGDGDSIHSFKSVRNQEEGIVDFEEDEGDCGWWKFRPKWAQYFNNTTWYLVVYCTLVAVQGMVINGIYNVSIPSMERRFQFTSAQTGLIYSCYDIGYFGLCLFISFHGNRAHRPKMLAITSFILGLGCFIFSIPHFTTGPYEYKGNSSDLCVANKPDVCEDVDGNDRTLNSYLYLFIFAMLIMGMGCTTLLTVGYSVLEDSLPKGKAAMHLGIATSMTLLGPVIGYVFGAYFLTIYVDVDVVDEVELTPDDPRWVGAWWIGFLLSGAIAWSTTIPMAGYTPQLPGSAKHRQNRESEEHANSGGKLVNQEHFGKSLRDMPIAMWTILKNPTFTFTSLAGVSESFVICGYTPFLAKIIQNQFHQTAAKAALYAGAIGIPGGVFGTLISGWIVKRFEMRTTSILRFCVGTCVTVFVMNVIMLMHCEETKISGVNAPYNDSSMYGLTAPCNENCSCQEEFYTPVCGTDEKVYFSPCHAGCSIQTGLDDEAFEDCKCINEEDDSAFSGICSEKCAVLIPFIILFFFIVLMNFTTTTPAVMVTMRCVPESQKSFAMGLSNFVMRGLGCIPGPIVFGKVIDTTCLLWQDIACEDKRGSCWLYASGDLAIDLYVIGAACKGISAILFGLAWYFYKPLVTTDDDNKEEEEEKNKSNAQFENPTFEVEQDVLEEQSPTLTGGLNPSSNVDSTYF